MASLNAPLLRVKDIRVTYPAYAASGGSTSVNQFVAVDNVSFTLEKGTTAGLAGESGCGKTTLGRTIAHFLHPDSGSVELEGEDMVKMSGNMLRKNRRKIQMIFQNPYASLNPRMTIDAMLSEAVRANAPLNKVEARKRVATLIDRCGLEAAVLKKYPHEMSGGQRQRVAIARALAADPELIIADEPVSSLDVSVAARIINLFDDLRKELGLTMLFISHDLSMVKYLSDTVYIMYRGRIVESGSSDAVFMHPLHPYTRNLIRAVPHLPEGPGTVPFFESVQVHEADKQYSAGCPYALRCEKAGEKCGKENPVLTTHTDGTDAHRCACFTPYGGFGRCSEPVEPGRS